MGDKMTTWEDEEKAIFALHAIKPDDSDAAIASIIADYLTTKSYQPPFHLMIDHDLSRSTERRIERNRKRLGPHGLPVPVRYDWKWADQVGTTTHDRAEAKRWAIEALLLGYRVNYCSKGAKSYSASGPGSIAQVRERQANKKAVAS